ncbi:MAG TPA: TAXI family TRAP transporter solute-binding subunit [Methyloceanibacter sp.]|nr:TAXI family TRAP transporter solute-binding subunit [Methyloceanibacter sp.]
MRIALAIGVCLLPLCAAAPAGAKDDTKDQAKPASQDRPSAQNLRQDYRAKLNDNTVTIMSGAARSTDAAIVQDVAAVLDDGAAMRVVPMIGKGPAQTLRDVMFMRGVDMGITHANVLGHYAKTGELGPLKSQITYIAKLFNEEMHVVAHAGVDDVRALDGKTVNVGMEGSGTEITARLVFAALGVAVREVHLDPADALAKLEAGEIDATVVVGGKPAPILAQVARGNRLKLLGLPYVKGLEDDTYPAILTHEDYPTLIEDGARIDTVAVCAVLVSFNWSKDGARSKKLEPFVERFFSNFDAFLAPPRHPKWQQVNFAATLEGWTRSPLAQSWIERAKTAVAADSGARDRFETFLAQADTGVPSGSDDERAKLFRAFLEWSKTQNPN